MAKPSISDLKMWVGNLFTKDDWDYNFSKITSWLSDGNGDLVVNSVQATNGLDMDGSQITNLAPATTGSQAVTLDQAETILNRTSYYYPFSIASGKVNSSGNSAYLEKNSDTQVTVLAGNVNPDLVVIQSDATVESITSNVVLTVGTANGTYNIIKEKGQSPIITTGKVTIGKVFPATQSAGDYFLDNSIVPFVGYKYDAVEGWVITPFCHLGYVTVSSGVATVTNFGYNDNKYNVNLVEYYVNGSSWYRVYADGWCEQGGTITSNNNNRVDVTLLKPMKNTDYQILTQSTNRTGIGVEYYNSQIVLNSEKEVDSFVVMNYYSEITYWKVCGYVA